MGVDELVLDELHHLVHHQAEQRLQGVHQQDQRHADAAGQECADIRDKSAHRRQNGDQTGIGDAEHRQGDEHQKAQQAGFDGLAAQELAEHFPDQTAHMPDLVPHLGLDKGVEQLAALTGEVLLVDEDIQGDDGGEQRVAQHRDGGGDRPHQRAQHTGSAGDHLLGHFPQVDGCKLLFHHGQHAGVDAQTVKVIDDAGQALLDLHDHAHDGLAQLRDQHQHRQGHHHDDAHKGQQQTEHPQPLARPFGLAAEQLFQAVLNGGHGHIEQEGNDPADHHRGAQTDQCAGPVGHRVEMGQPEIKGDPSEHQEGCKAFVLFFHPFSPDFPILTGLPGQRFAAAAAPVALRLFPLCTDFQPRSIDGWDCL